MPVYNREQYIKKAVESILNQTFTDFEFIIVNDGSTDKTLEILQSFDDKRIKIINNETNKGIVFSRNRGIKAAKAEFIGMFDSDDVALPEKFEIQLKFLKENPEFGMVGAWVKWIDENDKILKGKWKLSRPSIEIPAIMLFRNYFIQSSVLIRKEVLPEGLYSKGLEIGEDYKMWFEVSLKHKVTNIHQYLVLYRMHSENISITSDMKLENTKKLFKYIFKTLEIEPSEVELDAHSRIKNNKKIRTIEELEQIEKWLLKISNQNKKLGNYDQKILQKVIFNRWLKVCNKSKSLHFKMLKKLLFSPLSKFNL